MSLMGYEVKDIHAMQDTLVLVKNSIKNEKHPQYQSVMNGITLTLDLLEGLLEENRI